MFVSGSEGLPSSRRLGGGSRHPEEKQHDAPDNLEGETRLGVARFIDASIYCDTFPAICIA